MVLCRGTAKALKGTKRHKPSKYYEDRATLTDMNIGLLQYRRKWK